MLTLLLTLFLHTASAAEKPAALNPQVLATYDAKTVYAFGIAIQDLPARERGVCEDLLSTQLRMQAEGQQSWKMYSLYEVFERAGLMTGKLKRVSTITELRGSIPKYTAYRAAKTATNPTLAITISDLGPCGPDPLAALKGAYFMKCGSFLIGSGLLRESQIDLTRCPNTQRLVHPEL